MKQQNLEKEIEKLLAELNCLSSKERKEMLHKIAKTSILIKNREERFKCH